VPCGISDAGVTSLSQLLGHEPARVEDRFVQRAADVWEISELAELPCERRSVSIAIVSERGRVLLMHRREGFWQLLTGTSELSEGALQTAARELFEETGFSPRLEELRPLDYVHSFALGEVCNQETAFALRVAGEPSPRLDEREHDAFRWCTLEEALPLLPFAGLRRSARLALGREPA
jgi:8-oxo-dGTP pyrophosphatase MutT (NUDIX family)